MYAVLFIGIIIFDALGKPERLPGESEVSAVERGRGRAYRGGRGGDQDGEGDTEVRKRGGGHGGAGAGHR